VLGVFRESAGQRCEHALDQAELDQRKSRRADIDGTGTRSRPRRREPLGLIFIHGGCQILVYRFDSCCCEEWVGMPGRLWACG
jgi:hypothetical protein